MKGQAKQHSTRQTSLSTELNSVLQKSYDHHSQLIAEMSEVVIVAIREKNPQAVRFCSDLIEYHIDQVSWLASAIDALPQVFEEGSKASVPATKGSEAMDSAIEQANRELETSRYPKLPLSQNDIPVMDGPAAGIENTSLIDDSPRAEERNSASQYQEYLLRAMVSMDQGLPYVQYQTRMFDMMREDGVDKPGDYVKTSGTVPRWKALTGSLKKTLMKNGLITADRDGAALTERGKEFADGLAPRKKVRKPMAQKSQNEIESQPPKRRGRPRKTEAKTESTEAPKQRRARNPRKPKEIEAVEVGHQEGGHEQGQQAEPKKKRAYKRRAKKTSAA